MFFSVQFLALLTSLIPTSTGLYVSSEKTYQQIKPGQGFQIMCQADTPLVGCQIMNRHTNTLYELSRGKSSSHKYQYLGTGLVYGQCGVNVQASTNEEFVALLVCRVRASGSRWMHAVSVVEAHDQDVTLFPVECGSRTRLVNDGHSLTLEYAAADKIQSCQFHWPGRGEPIDEDWAQEGSEHEFVIDNTRLDKNFCRLTLNGLVPESSGFVVAKVQAKELYEGKIPIHICVTTLIVMEPPDKPMLIAQECIRGIEPSCRVGPSRPRPVLIWLAGDEVIRTDDNHDLETGAVWVWEYEPQSVIQNLNSRLTMEIGGRDVTCRVAHIALPPNQTLDSRLPMPTETTYSNMFLSIVYMLIGIGTVMLAVALAVALISAYRYMTRTWCFIELEK